MKYFFAVKFPSCHYSAAANSKLISRQAGVPKLASSHLLDYCSIQFCSQSQVKVTLRLTVSQSVSHDQILLLFDSYGLVFLGRPLCERTDLLFVYAAGPRQLSVSGVWVSLDSWPYFTVSDLRLPFSSPPMNRGVTVEVFDPASTGVSSCSIVPNTFL
jgi:hypothetical protein